MNKTVKTVDQEEGLVDIHAASSLLNVSNSTIYKYLRRGLISSIRLSPRGKHLFRASILLQEVGQ